MKRLFIVTLIVTTAVLAACSSKKDKADMLSAHEWVLDEIVYDGNDFTETPPAGVTLMFADSTKRISGKGGCNVFFGTYSVSENNKIEIGALGSTLMACPELEFEGKYFKLLEAVSEFSVDENILELKAIDEKATLVYKPVLKAVQ